MSKAHEILMRLERHHKHSVRYEEVDEAGNPVPNSSYVIGKVYFMRHAFNGEAPKGLKITIEELTV